MAVVKALMFNDIFIDYKMVFDEKEEVYYVPKEKSLVVLYIDEVVIKGKKKAIIKKRKLTLMDLVNIREDMLWKERKETKFTKEELQASLENPEDPRYRLAWVSDEDLDTITYAELMEKLAKENNMIQFKYYGKYLYNKN